MAFTLSQQTAVAARGNVLVVAGAGTGKTSTLVERCIDCLTRDQPPVSLDEILMVTFTEAAAAEMRQRIRARLEKLLADHPDDIRWPEQLALFDTAHIGTLHSFCLQLIRRHFYELELDPQLAVQPEEETKLLEDETLEKIFQEHYAEKTEMDAAVQRLIQSQARDGDKVIRSLVLKLHHFTQTLHDPEKWIAGQLAMFRSDEPAQWRPWLERGIADWRALWLPELDLLAATNIKAAECAAILRKLPRSPSGKEIAAAIEQLVRAYYTFPKNQTGALRKPLESFFKDAFFLRSLTRVDGKKNPLDQDWDWSRAQMITLLELASEFTAKFTEAKRELGVVDFHDLEQCALRLLWDRATNQPTPAAMEWRRKLRFVFVDEYQDINEAQDAILKALSRDGAGANRFLVGDVKQSIYRFRLADPRIFQEYVAAWSRTPGQVIPLADNFRSRESILGFVNSVFAALMRRELGGVTYDEDAKLRFGDPQNRNAPGIKQDSNPGVELHLRVKGNGESNAADAETASSAAWTELENLEEAAKEARMTALRLRELRERGHLIWDDATKAMRPAQWSDMAVLLRSPSGKAESYAREFARLGVPLTVARGGFYESAEVSDLLNLLQLLDNPLQDLPALAALRSPLAALSLNELADIRLALPKGPKGSKAHFWTALQRWHENNPSRPAWQKIERFLKHFAVWRRLARQVSLSRCLETVLAQTHYADWLLTQPRGEQRHANVRRLLSLAQQFDQFQRQGLFRFLRFVEAQQAADTEPQVAAVSGEDAVRLMSIHQSKGLEFPIVVVGDTGKQFNFTDLAADIILDPEYGLCPQIKPPHTGQRYPSLPYWLARQRQKRESLGEELRLLYVAMTRARDTLILTGTVGQKKFERWQEPAEINTAMLLTARKYLDWLAMWSANFSADIAGSVAGKNKFWRWNIYEDMDARLLDVAKEAASVESDAIGDHLSPDALHRLHERLLWTYPHVPATQQAAKTSVSILRRQLAGEDESEAVPFFRFQKRNLQSERAYQDKTKRGFAGLSATETGVAHHKFLQFVSLEKTDNSKDLQEEARRMESLGALSAEESASLDFEGLALFWASELGRRIRLNAQFVRRELEFTARFAPDELTMSGEMMPDLADEFVLVQGVADLAILLPREIWIVDFKTDRIAEAELPERIKMYEPQLRLYAQALSRIYKRPVSEAHLYFIALKKSVKVSIGERRNVGF